MSELTPPEPKLPEPPRRDWRIVWPATASAMLHAGVLVFLLWHPSPYSAQAAPPPAIDVELVPPPEAASAPEPTAEESKEEGDSGATSLPAETSSAEPPPAETTPGEPPPGEKGSAEPPPSENNPTEPPPAETAPAEPPPAEATPTEPPPSEPADGPSAAEASAPETPSGAAAPETASEAATAGSEPVRGLEASAEEAPIPLMRPRELTAQGSVSDGAVFPDSADTGDTTDGAAPPASSALPDVATLKLGALRNAERFYLKSMLSEPSMARARAVLKKLPTEKRLLQTCNIEALAQIGNAGEGFAPDVVMPEAYARLETTGTRVAANGAIFRSEERWYGLAFDCTLSDDLSKVTAFSYRLGADVTDAVLARLNKT